MEELLCPKCRHQLTFTQDAYFCENCQSHFEIRDGIPILLPDIQSVATLADIAAWDDKDSGRSEHAPPWRALLSKEAWIQEFLDHMDRVSFDGTVLEIGGGICWASIIIKLSYPLSRVTATDVSASALVQAKEVAEMCNVQVDRYLAVDIQSSPFPDDYFDIVFGCAVLHHIPNLPKALTEIRRILKPGGIYFGISETTVSKLLQLIRRIMNIQIGEEVGKYEIQEASYTLSKWRNLFKTAGFDELNIYPCRSSRYWYHTRMLQLYSLITDLMPGVTRTQLGCKIHIVAKKA